MRGCSSVCALWFFLIIFSQAATSLWAEETAALPKEAQMLLAKAAALARYEARFSLEAREEDGQRVQLEGSLTVQPPKSRRLEIRFGGEEEIAQLHVTNPQVEWQYVPDAKTAYRTNEPEEVAGPHRLFSDVVLSSLRFVERLQSDGKTLYRFEADPADSIAEGAPVPVAKVRMDVAEEDGLVRQVALLDAQGEAVLTQRYFDIRLNPDVAPETFLFEPPEGVEVVEVE